MGIETVFRRIKKWFILQARWMQSTSKHPITLSEVKMTASVHDITHPW
jgi:hypothetical protein